MLPHLTKRSPDRTRPGGRLGVYVDTTYRTDPDRPGRVCTGSEAYPFMRFMCEVGGHFDGLVVFGRRDPGGTGADHELPSPVEVVEMPYYENLARGLQVLRAAPGTLARMWRGLDRVDSVLVFGPYPFSPALVLFGLLRRRRVVLGVRQDTMRYFRNRLRHPLAAPVLAPLWVIDRLYRVLSRWLPTVVVGRHLERQYGGPRSGLEALRISLVRAADVVERPASLDWAGPVELLAVGRIDKEKNPLLLVDALAELEHRRPGRFRLVWLGEGPMGEVTRRRARERGVADLIDFGGFVPFGPDLLRRYRAAHVFVHVAVTEAFGQVLTEAMASGVAVVATAVGGVPAAVDDGAAGLLVPPRDLDALVSAIETISDDADLRARLIAHGLELTRRHTLEAEAERVARIAA